MCRYFAFGFEIACALGDGVAATSEGLLARMSDVDEEEGEEAAADPGPSANEKGDDDDEDEDEDDDGVARLTDLGFAGVASDDEAEDFDDKAPAAPTASEPGPATTAPVAPSTNCMPSALSAGVRRISASTSAMRLLSNGCTGNVYGMWEDESEGGNRPSGCRFAHIKLGNR